MNSELEVSSGGYVFLWSASVFARLLRPLAECLKERYDVKTVLLTDSVQRLPSSKAYDFDPAAFAEIIEVEDWLRPRPITDLPSAKTLADAANALERRLRVNIVDAIRTDRHLGIDFVTGSVFPRSRYGTSAGFGQTLDIALRLCAGFEQLLNQYRPFALLSSASPIAPAALVRVGMATGVPMRMLIPSPLERQFYWTADPYSLPIGLAEKFNTAFAASTEQRESGPFNGEKDEESCLPPPSRAKLYFAEMHKRATLRFLLTRIYGVVRREVGHQVYRRHQVYGRYWLGGVLWLIVERWWWTRRVLREKPVMGTLPADLPFVFFPLHLEPEATLMSEAQMADHQLIIVDWLSKRVPPGWHIVVKEHPGATTSRPKGFWDRVRAYPNVVVAAALENAEAITQRAQAVADIHGSPGIQAAVSGRPVITFNRNYSALVMPHVLLATSYEETGAVLRKIRDGAIPDEATRRRAGKAFLDAVRECGIPIHDSHLIAGVPGLHKIDPQDVATIAETFMESLKMQPSARHVPAEHPPSNG